MDVETTNKEYGGALALANNLLLACWYDSRTNTYHHTFGEEWEQKELLEAIAGVDFIVAQNAKFELQWFDRCGLDLHDVLVYDTMLAEWVLLGNRKDSKSLGAMMERRGLKGKEDVVGGMIKLGINPENIPASMLLTYCYEDVRATLQLYQHQLAQLVEQDQLHLVYSRCLLTPVLADMEKQGVMLDKDAIEEEYHSVAKEHEETIRKLQSFANINYNSKQQVAALLYDQLGFEEAKRKGQPIRTAKGARSAAAATISSLRATTASQKEFLETYAQLAKLSTKLSKSLRFFKEVVDNRGSVFYGMFNQGNTATHRLSSSGRPIETAEGDKLSAQLQNLPREYKRFVKPKKKGWKILDCDGSQLEFRVGADLGHDDVAYDEIINDVDVHTNTAIVYLEDGTQPEFKGLSLKEARQPAKPQTFKPMFGGRGTTKAEQKYCKFFQEKYKGIFGTQTSWTHEVLKTGKLLTPYGMIFYWPGTGISRSGYIDNTTSIFNYPIQGLSTAEIIPIVLVSLWHQLKDWDVIITLTVHDSIVMEIGPDVNLRELYKIIARAFTADVYTYLEKVYNYKFHVPLGMEVKVGDRWGQGTGYKAKAFPEQRDRIIWQK